MRNFAVSLTFILWMNFQALGQKLCYECDSSFNNSNCISDLKIQNYCENEQSNGCYHYHKNEIIKRGCVDNLSPHQETDCNEGIFCKICQTNYCNDKKSFQKCYSCNSDDDPNCATLRSDMNSIECENYMDNCKVFVKPNTTTYRGCSSEIQSIECHPLAVNCKECSDNLCNGEIFPSNRLKCFHEISQCNKNNNNCFRSMDENLNASYPCEMYNFRDSCFSYLTENNTVIRGCLSDTLTSEFCTKNFKRCKICQTSNCNNERIIREPKLSCIKCDNSEKCLWGFDQNEAEKCQSKVYFYEEESCFTLVVSNRSVIRGCTGDTNVCKINNCTICSETDGCNNENIRKQNCYKTNDSSHVSKRGCRGLINYESQGCYTWNNGSFISRGCISELSMDYRVKCKNDTINCITCIGQNCNGFSNKSVEIKINFLLILVSFLPSLMFNKI